MNAAGTDFLKDFVRSAVKSGIAFALVIAVPAAMLAGSTDAGLGMLLGLALIVNLHFAVPLGFSLYGVVKGRPGFAIGPLAMLGLAIACAIAVLLGSQWANAKKLESMQVREFLPAHRTHTMIAIEIHNNHCDPLCMQLLANSQHLVAMKDTDGPGWTVYKRENGLGCRAPENQESHLAFVRAGFANICAIREKRTSIDDALILRSMAWVLSKQGVIEGFNGHIYELLEREEGRERLLGRWVAGRVAPSSLPAILVLGAIGFGFDHKIDVGPDFSRDEFYGAALGIPLSGSAAPGTASLPELLDATEALLANPSLRNEAIAVYHEIAGRGGDDRIRILQPRIERLLASNDPADAEVGVVLLDAIWRIDVRFAQPHIERLLGSDAPELVAIGLRGLGTFRKENSVFAHSRLIELAFSKFTESKKPPIAELLRSRIVNTFDGPLPIEARHRAKAALSDENLSEEHRRMLLAIIGHGGPAMRQEAGEAVLALEGIAFVETVSAVGSESGAEGWYALDHANPRGWTANELGQLVERLPEVPDDFLRSYIGSFSRNQSFDAVMPRLIELVEQRLDAAERAPIPDQRQIDELTYLVKILPTDSRA